MDRLGLKHPDAEFAELILKFARGPFDTAAGWLHLTDLADVLPTMDPGCRLELEHQGVDSSLIALLAERMSLEPGRLRSIIGLVPSDALAPRGELVRGLPAFAVLALLHLLGKATQLSDESTAPGAKDFDVAAWLGTWIATPQPAISGLTPAQIVALPTGLPVLLRILGAIESGAFL
jgi:hypothetical protein